jgi:hypothetical protein
MTPTSFSPSEVWPEPDARMTNMIAGFDEHKRPRPMSYAAMEELTNTWPLTAATPAGPAERLLVARDMFALAYYCYEMLPIAGAWALMGVEGALRLRLESTAPLAKLIEMARDRDLIPEGSEGALQAGREIRNRLVHGETPPVWSLGMADPVMRTCHAIVAELFPD